jgi:hypothetical protein
VLICPFRYRQILIGPHAPAPAAQEIVRTVETEVEIGGQVAIINRG